MAEDDGWQDAETGWYTGGNPPPRRFDPMTGKPLTGSAAAGASTAPQPEPPRQRRGPGIGVIASITVVVLAALAGFGIVWFFNHSNHSNGPTASNTVNQAPQQPSSGPSSSQSSSSPGTAEFPAGLRSTCLASPTGTDDITDANVRVKGDITCGFVADVANQARQHLSDRPNETNFHLDVASSSSDHTYDVTCSEDSGLTQCSFTSKNTEEGGTQKSVYIRN